MHEFAITEGILDIALRTAREAGAQRITKINLLIGAWSNIVDDSVAFYVDLLSRGTPAEGAVLSVRREPPLITCRECGYRGMATPPLPRTCATCGGTHVRSSGSMDLSVESIEVADEN
jgi:hydrogenase nickel incorporation protein HypA/HybF